jgi:hypothetical protein
MGLLDAWYAAGTIGQLTGLDRVGRRPEAKPLQGAALQYFTEFQAGRCVEIARPRDHEAKYKRVELRPSNGGSRFTQAWVNKRDPKDVLIRDHDTGIERWFKLTPTPSPWTPR